MSQNPTACLLIIGNEVLSGRTQDANLNFIARRCSASGITLAEVRVIPDVRATIVATVNAVRAQFDHVFTTGGIGPTHDDITSECVAEAFGLPWEPHPVAWETMARHYAAQTPPAEFNPARQRMATMPRGASLIETAASVAPGFSVGNVHVMAGVPRIMQAMFDALLPSLTRGVPVSAATWHGIGLLEGNLAEGLTAIQNRFPMLDLGSYPFYRPGGNGVALVAKGIEAAAVAAAAEAIRALIEGFGVAPIEGEPR